MERGNRKLVPSGKTIKEEEGPYHFWEQLSWEVMDSFDHYTYGWEKEYHPQDDTGSAKKQNIEKLNWENSALLVYTMTVAKTQPETLRPNHNLPHSQRDHPQSQNWYCIISRRIQVRILSPKSTPGERGSPSYIISQLLMSAGMEGSLRLWNTYPHPHNMIFHSSLSWTVQFNCKERRL